MCSTPNPKMKSGDAFLCQQMDKADLLENSPKKATSPAPNYGPVRGRQEFCLADEKERASSRPRYRERSPSEVPGGDKAGDSLQSAPSEKDKEARRRRLRAKSPVPGALISTQMINDADELSFANAAL